MQEYVMGQLACVHASSMYLLQRQPGLLQPQPESHFAGLVAFAVGVLPWTACATGARTVKSRHIRSIHVQSRHVHVVCVLIRLPVGHLSFWPAVRQLIECGYGGVYLL